MERETVSRRFMGVWIPREIYLNPNLTRLEKDILVEIDSLDNEEGCFATNKYLASFCQCSIRGVTKSVANLEKMGYISVTNVPGVRRIMHSNIRVMFPETGEPPSHFIPQPSHKVPAGIAQSAMEYSTKCQQSNIPSNTTNNIDRTTTPSPLLQGDVVVDDTADAVGSYGVLPGWDAFITAYQQNIEALPRPLKLQGLLEDFRTLGPEVMQEAIKRTVDANPTNAAPYFDAVVREWIKAGVDTPEKARLTAEQRTRKGVSTRAAAPTVDEEWEKEKRRRYNDLSPERLYG